MTAIAPLPSFFILDPLLHSWLLEDIGRGDQTTQALFTDAAPVTNADWVAKEKGVIAGLPIAGRVFTLLDPQSDCQFNVTEGDNCEIGTNLAQFTAPTNILLTGERVALNLVMRLSGIATATRQYVERIRDYPAQLVDTRKTTPGLRVLEKYASQVGGAKNHRLGLDDAVMIKDNHIQAAGGISAAITHIRSQMPYPLSIEVETTTLDEVQEALQQGVEIIMLDNMTVPTMKTAVEQIRQHNPHIKIEASGNITLDRIATVAETGVDYISTSAPITRSSWLDLSMKF
ncbi:carboxylating nicotinate-nucleotide diphosphorylase [Spirulina sp. CS-785/01]|uniref:carboxylating nicotinate-nucleotide diphosphorylase n=1 Tax=Spirulina sp. CS-785/01 TaxID=3021716 RepID=UPI00232A95F6|nr:carboxylating nicotinate-nucleotide diphosphorylase [Spirulina sp. CS-785/01]MDB9314364.1 carboxylating nicotinate-nucleotide diphosphorylase [Spirulina sp. CS-785/01]